MMQNQRKKNVFLYENDRFRWGKENESEREYHFFRLVLLYWLFCLGAKVAKK